jgi:hypothetical protein
MNAARLPPLFAAAALLAAMSQARAETITFIHTGSTGAGSVGGVAFADAPFVLTARGDTENIDNYGFGVSIDHDWAQIAITGVGTFELLTGTRTFLSVGGIVGFGRALTVPPSTDLYVGPTDAAAFAGYDLTTSIGPVAGATRLVFWDFEPLIQSTGGIIRFDNILSMTGTFQAVVPAPATGGALAFAGMVALRRRRA